MWKGGAHWQDQEGRGILKAHPELTQEISRQLDDICTTGISMSCLLARSIILAVLTKKKPDLLDGFKCSARYVSDFLESVMDWTVRKGMQAAAKVPTDAPVVCERALYRLVHLITFYNIPPSLVINMDQTGIILLMTKNQTYAKKGSWQVDVAGRDEKRAYSLCVASTPDGHILPFQTIWGRQTKASTPSQRAPSYAESVDLGFDHTFAKSTKKSSHYSTLKTMQEWAERIMSPFIKQQIEFLGLCSNQKAVLFLDCYPVHIGKKF
jgi:hypothetical protein